MTISNQSPHQPLVGQTFLRDGCTYLCLAAHEDAVLVLERTAAGQPTNYIVCHRPYIEKSGVLVWSAGDYFTIPNYQSIGRANSMAAAFADAVECLLEPCAIAFRFETLDDDAEEEPATLLAEIMPQPDADQLAEIEDALASYSEATSAYTYQQCVEKVLACFPQLHFHILQPETTFHI